MYLRIKVEVDKMWLVQVMLLVLVALAGCVRGQADSALPSDSNDTTTSTLSSASASSLATTTAISPTITARNKTDSETTTTTSAPAIESSSAAGETLLSNNEYVDFTETPTLLVDELRGNGNRTSSDAAEAETDGRPKPQEGANDTSSGGKRETTTAPVMELEVVTTTLQPDNGAATEAPSPALVGSPVSSTAEEEPAPEEELVEEDGSPRLDPFEPPKNVSQYMDYIERLFHDLRHQITDLFEPHIPQLIRTSQMVQLSGSCSYDMLRMALALRQFEPWALRMIDSSGKVPEGIFEGSFTALGSYDECLATVFAGAQQQQQPQTRGKYCLVNVSPYLPPKPPADRAERMFQEEANRRNYTKDDQFARLSPMFYYMKFRIGVCIPSTCLERDLDSISDALSSSLRLNITIPHCRVNQTQPLTRPQLIGGLVFALVLALVLGATIMDYWRRKLEQVKRRELLVFCQMDEKQLEARAAGLQNLMSVPFALSNKASSLPLADGAGGLASSKRDNKADSSMLDKSGRERFNNRLERHWSWMSFSLLTNFKLHFVPSKVGLATGFAGPGSRMETKSDEQSIKNVGLPAYYCESEPLGEKQMMVSNQQPIIRCLDGIRVLSLCWVIVANSYITLDPRATKRLTVTREAPKDFLFQLVVQASLAIETFFFLSGLLVSLSFAHRLLPASGLEGKDQTSTRKPLNVLHWFQFYVHRYVRMTPATMLVISFTMFAFRFGDGPLWIEATHKAHTSCSENWWRHLLHVANFIDTRQMCFIHYWYIAADMQLFLFAPLLMFLLYRRQRIGYAIATLIGLGSIGNIFYTTYMRNLPPTLLFYNSDPESRREYGNTIMTKPLTHVLPYMVGIIVGKWLSTTKPLRVADGQQQEANYRDRPRSIYQNNRSLTMLFGIVASLVALTEIFLPYKWNNSYLPNRLMGAIYAALFRFCWSLVLAYLVVSCAHKRDKRCRAEEARRRLAASVTSAAHVGHQTCCCHNRQHEALRMEKQWSRFEGFKQSDPNQFCVCGSGGSLLNRMLSLGIFTHLSKLSFVAYLIHLPLMSVFVSQTRGLFAFSHSLVIHLALSYLVMTFTLSFILVHIIEFPFITFERYLFAKLVKRAEVNDGQEVPSPSSSSSPTSPTESPSPKRNTKLNINAYANSNCHSSGNISETFRISERL